MNIKVAQFHWFWLWAYSHIIMTLISKIAQWMCTINHLLSPPVNQLNLFQFTWKKESRGPWCRHTDIVWGSHSFSWCLQIKNPSVKKKQLNNWKWNGKEYDQKNDQVKIFITKRHQSIFFFQFIFQIFLFPFWTQESEVIPYRVVDVSCSI